MNKSINGFGIGCITLLSTACIETADLNVVTEKNNIYVTAVREGLYPETRTFRDADGSVEWSPFDEISLFYSETDNGGSKFTSVNSEPTALAEFKGRLDGYPTENATYLYGVYPFSLETRFKNNVTTVSLPAEQTATEGTFANGLFPTIARSKDLNLTFYNICGGVKFTILRNDITSVRFKGNNGERLTGSADVIFDNNGRPVVTGINSEGKDEIVVYAPTGGTFQPGQEYYIVAYPTELSSGYTLTFRTSGMKEGKYVNAKAVKIKRSIFGTINQADQKVSTWADVSYLGGGFSSGIYLGITGFNDRLYTYPVRQLTNSTKSGFDTFINGFSMKNGTLLYYSVDHAISDLQSISLPSDLSKVAIITFTDGLDQGSIMMNETYNNNADYLNAINRRIRNETVCRLPITSYSIGLQGTDVVDETMFINNLKLLSSEGIDNNKYAYDVNDMSSVNAIFRNIAEQLSKSSYFQTIKLKMPGLPDGTLVRFTFDNVDSADKSEVYIEGIFKLSTKSLENLEFKGMTSTSGSVIKGVIDGIFVSFTFENVHTPTNNLINKYYIKEWNYITSYKTWQINSEFDKTDNAEITTEQRSLAVMLVLDCSSSLSNDFTTAKKNAKDFINTLYDASTMNLSR